MRIAFIYYPFFWAYEPFKTSPPLLRPYFGCLCSGIAVLKLYWRWKGGGRNLAILWRVGFLWRHSLFPHCLLFLATSLRRSTDMPMTAERYGQDLLHWLLLPSWRKLSLRYPLRQVLIWPIISMDWRRYLETLGALHWHPCFHFGAVVLRIVLYWPRWKLDRQLPQAQRKRGLLRYSYQFHAISGQSLVIFQFRRFFTLSR